MLLVSHNAILQQAAFLEIVCVIILLKDYRHDCSPDVQCTLKNSEADSSVSTAHRRAIRRMKKRKNVAREQAR